MRQLFPVTGMPGIPGTKLTITIPVLNKTSAITFTGAGTLTAQQVADQLLPFLLGIDARFEVQIIANRVPPGLTNTIELRIDAPFTFHNDPTDTAPIFQYPAASLMLEGAGAGVGVKGYKVDRSLRDLGVEEGDLLALDGLCYKIARVVDDPSDEWPFQRLTLLDELPIAPTTSWKIPGKVSSNFLTSTMRWHQ
jgi:hypothetical protein